MRSGWSFWNGLDEEEKKMEAVAVESLSPEMFADIRAHGAREILGTGCIIVPWERYAAMLEDYEDAELEREAARRLKEPEGRTYTQEEIMRMYGITQEEIDAMPEVELD